MHFKRALFLLTCVWVFASVKARADNLALNFDAPQLIPKKEEPLAKDTGPWSKISPSFDLRSVLLIKENPEGAGRQGLGLMQSVLGLDYAPGDDLAIVTRYDLGFMRTGPRDVYVDFQGIPEINSLKVGRFNLNFGHKLSDHRSYVKKFFAVSINDFESGVEARKNMGRVNATFALVQGLGSGETFQNNEQLLTPAIDLRGDFDLGASEWTVGTSALQTYRAQGNGNPQVDRNFAWSVFAKSKISRLGLWGEVTWGHKRSFLVTDLATIVGDAAYSSSVKDKKSLGFWGRADFELKKKITAFYEYDQIVLDTHYHADRFQKHSVGTKFSVASSADLEPRLEFPLEGRKSNPDLRRANDTFLVTLHAWF